LATITGKKPAANTEPETDKDVSSSTVPKPPAKHFKPGHFSQFTDYLATIPEVEWSHLTIYLYRVWPVIIRQKKDAAAPNYIDKYGAPITEDNIRQRWGAGTYNLRLTDANKSKWGELCAANLQISDNWETCPPVLDPAELDEQHKDNQAYVTWARSKGLMSTQPNPAAGGGDAAMYGLLRELVADLRTRKPQNPSEEQALNRLMAMFEAANARSIDMIARAQDPTAVVKMFSEMRGLMGGEAGGSNKIFELLLTQMFQQNTLLMKMLMEKPAAGAPGGLGDFTAMLDVLDRLNERFGKRGGDASDSPWLELGKYAVEKVPETMRELSNLVGAMRAPGPAGRPSPPATVQTLPATPAPETAEAGAHGAVAQEAGDMSQVHALISQYGGMLLAAINRGQTGDDFAEKIDGLFPQAYDQMLAMGKSGIMDALRSHPIWEHLAPLEAKLDTFIDQFLDYGAAEPPALPPDVSAKPAGKDVQ